MKEDIKINKQALENFRDDLSIPSKTSYYFNRAKLFFFLTLVLIPISFFINGWGVVIGSILFLVFFIGVKARRGSIILILKNITNKKVQFYISNYGIYLDPNIVEQKGINFSVGFIEWKDVNSIFLDLEKGKLTLAGKKNTKYYHIEFLLWKMEITDYEEFIRIIRIYMLRFYKKNGFGSKI